MTVRAFTPVLMEATDDGALVPCGRYHAGTSTPRLCWRSNGDAKRVAAFIKPMDSYAIVAVSEATVKVWTAQSQSVRAMGAKAFQASKTAVLDWIAALIGVDRDSLPNKEAS